jgi:hypothetical protein
MLSFPYVAFVQLIGCRLMLKILTTYYDEMIEVEKWIVRAYTAVRHTVSHLTGADDRELERAVEAHQQCQSWHQHVEDSLRVEKGEAIQLRHILRQGDKGNESIKLIQVRTRRSGTH